MDLNKQNASPDQEEASKMSVENIDQKRNEDTKPEQDYSISLPSAEAISIEVKTGKPSALEKDERYVGLFKQMPINEWLEESKARPIPKMLFGEFWFEGELCILFADTNLGKSILGVQIANSINKGEPIEKFRLEAKSQMVLYFDFELSMKQFENRYSENFENHYKFDNTFVRVEFNDEAVIASEERKSKLNDSVISSIEKAITKSGARIIVIDNITWLTGKIIETTDAAKLMMDLSYLKKKYNVSMLVLAHTPKRDSTNKITVNDLGGSKMLSNFADSIFAIGTSQKDTNLRYLKQIKQRNVELTYGEDNVCVCSIVKPSNFLQFKVLGYDAESEHLTFKNTDKKRNIEEVHKLKAEGLSNVKIAEELGVSEGAIRKWLKASIKGTILETEKADDPKVSLS